jgi:hypothetical protein
VTLDDKCFGGDQEMVAVNAETHEPKTI